MPVLHLTSFVSFYIALWLNSNSQEYTPSNRIDLYMRLKKEFQMSINEQTINNDEVQSHSTKIGRDHLLHIMAHYAIQNKIPSQRVDRVIADFAIKALEDKPKFWLSGSIYRSFVGNPQDYLMTKVIKVAYGKNAGMIVGNLIHLARDFAIKHKIANKRLPKLVTCIRLMKVECHKSYQMINPDERENNPKIEIFLEACRLFKLYYKEVLPHNKSTDSEVSMEVNLPLELFKNASNCNKFAMTGIADDVTVDENGDITIGDLKTSSKKISKYVEMNPILKKHYEKKRELEQFIKEEQKTVNKFSKAVENLDEAKATLSEVETKLADAIANGKAINALEKRIVKWEGEVTKWNENLESFNKANNQILLFESELSELEEIIKPLYEIYEDEKAKADLLECIKLHEPQLAHYAICYMFKFNKQPKRLRVENLVKNKFPEVQIFEWEITEGVLEAAEERITSIIQLLELMLDGVDPMILFRANPESYLGTQTEKFKDELREIIENDAEID